MEDPLKSRVNYTEVLSHIRERTDALDEREAELAIRHERLLKLEAVIGDEKKEANAEIARLGRQIMNLRSDVAKGQLKVDEENRRFSEVKADHETKTKELKKQIASLEAGYNLHYERNAELAKTLELKALEINDKNIEINQLIEYHKAQEKVVQDVLRDYNEQLHSSKSVLADFTKQCAIQEDHLASLRDEVSTMQTVADSEKEKLKLELLELEQQRGKNQKVLNGIIADLNQAQVDLEKVTIEHDKTMKQTEEFIQKSLSERKAAGESRALLKRVEADASDERRRLKSDKAIYGRL